jgi:hypothetical protein
MQYLYGDESNLEPVDGTFFIYSGVVISSDAALSLHSEVQTIRTRYGYTASDPLKFNAAERPSYVSADAHRLAKQSVITSAVAHGCVLNTTFTLHNVAANSTTARTYAINSLAWGFQSYLQDINDQGMVFIDTYDDGTLTNVLREKFQRGFTGPLYEDTPLERVVNWSQSSNGTSHFSSVADIVVGTLRYAANNRNDPSPRTRTLAGNLVKSLSPMWHRDPVTGKVKQSSLRFCPRQVYTPEYRAQYLDLKLFLAMNGAESLQPV